MTAAMDFRGPDGFHHHVGADFALGHCAFHTTPGSAEAPQPLFSEDRKFAVVMDGWLANPDELRAELESRKARVRGPSDAELVLQAYAEWGDDCANHLEGEYAIVIYDAYRRRAFCLRDHMGMRPLLYHWDGRRLLVASEVAGVLAAGDFPQTLDAYRMAENLASEFYAPDQTVWTGVMRLPLTTAMIVDATGPMTQQYWSLPLDLSIRYRREEDYFEHYREMLMDSVRRASRSCAPIGCEVSGGHDSSAIYAMVRRLQEAGQLQATDALAFTMTGLPGTISDEIEYARDVTRFFGTPLYEAPRTLGEIAWFEQNIVKDRDMPEFPNAQSMVAEAALVRSKGCRVLLDGEGGDEFAGGSYYYIHEMLREGRLGMLARELRLMAGQGGAKYTARRVFRFGLRPFGPIWVDATMRHIHRYRQPWRAHLGKGPHWVAKPLLDQLAEQREIARVQDDIWRIRNPSKLTSTRQPCVRRSCMDAGTLRQETSRP